MKRKRRLAIDILAQYCDIANIDIPHTIDTNDGQVLDGIWVDIPLSDPEMNDMAYSNVHDLDREKPNRMEKT